MPDWLKRRVPSSETLGETRGVLRTLGLHTVCESAVCPNMGECFGRRTATFMILGDRCTRACGFCAVEHGETQGTDPGEPARVAEAARRLGLRHVVVTSVTRDDLPDGGASVFAAAVERVHESGPGVTVEVLTPDFRGDTAAVDRVVEAGPDVYNHNVETVPGLYVRVRPGADYGRSLRLLARVKEQAPGMMTKSGIMLGLGESREAVLGVMDDLRGAGCDLLTIGQYLRPGKGQLPVAEFVEPARFDQYRREAECRGFKSVASGPFVRSSYRARSMLGEVKCT